MGRFGKRDDLVVHEQEPFNAETGIEALGDSVTEIDAFVTKSQDVKADQGLRSA